MYVGVVFCFVLGVFQQYCDYIIIHMRKLLCEDYTVYQHISNQSSVTISNHRLHQVSRNNNLDGMWLFRFTVKTRTLIDSLIHMHNILDNYID